jgi:hypothetical protein
MVSQNFKKKQNNLFAIYYWIGFVGWIAAGLAIFVASFTAPSDSGPDSYGQIIMWSGIIILILTSIYRYFLKQKLQSSFWNEYARIIKGNIENVTQKFHPALVGPVIKEYSTASSVQRYITGSYHGFATTLQQVLVTYTKDTPGDNDATYNLRYIIQAVELQSKVPHIFIASKQESRKKLAAPSSLWSLVNKLDQSQKLQDLEGDFGKYFDVYTSHRESDGLAYKREIDALRVLTPDVMLTLRDKGFNFDYEFYENYLYVITEPNMLTAGELENFIKALDAALNELLPQLQGHYFADDGMKLKINKSALTGDILFGPLVTAAKFTLFFLILVFLGATLGNLFA